MRLHLLKFTDAPGYRAAKTALNVISGIDGFLRPGNSGHVSRKDFIPAAEKGLKSVNAGRATGAVHLENISARVEKILSAGARNGIQADRHAQEAFELLREALRLIYRDLVSFRRKGISVELKKIAAHAGRNLGRAGLKTACDEGNFVENLQTGSVYSDLGRCFDDIAKYADEAK